MNLVLALRRLLRTDRFGRFSSMQAEPHTPQFVQHDLVSVSRSLPLDSDVLSLSLPSCLALDPAVIEALLIFLLALFRLFPALLFAPPQKKTTLLAPVQNLV